jgi:hypothetical protein
MIEWIQTSRLSINNFFSLEDLASPDGGFRIVEAG